MMPPTPAAAPALTWPEPPKLCPVCCGALPYPDDRQGHLRKRYRCGQLLWLIGKQWELAVDESCREASHLAVAQRQRADKAESDRDTYHAHADREYEQRVRLVADYDKLDAERDALAALVKTLREALEASQDVIRTSGDVTTHRSECSRCSQKLNDDWDDSDCPRLTKLYDAEADARSRWSLATDALAAAPDPNAPSLDDFTHWPFPPETALPARDAQDGA